MAANRCEFYNCTSRNVIRKLTSQKVLKINANKRFIKGAHMVSKRLNLMTVEQIEIIGSLKEWCILSGQSIQNKGGFIQIWRYNESQDKY